MSTFDYAISSSEDSSASLVQMCSIFLRNHKFRILV